MRLFKNNNRKSKQSNTGFKGISKRKDTGKYIAQVFITRTTREGKSYTDIIYSKTFNTLKEAVVDRQGFIDKLY